MVGGVVPAGVFVDERSHKSVLQTGSPCGAVAKGLKGLGIERTAARTIRRPQCEGARSMSHKSITLPLSPSHQTQLSPTIIGFGTTYFREGAEPRITFAVKVERLYDRSYGGLRTCAPTMEPTGRGD